MREDKKKSDTVRCPFLFASCLLAAQLAVASPSWKLERAATSAWTSAADQQERKLTGVVYDSDGEVLPGAAVFVKGDMRYATVTDLDGRFTLKVPANAKTLTVSFVGFDPKEVTIGKKSNYTITLESSSALDEVEVVATGYQMFKKNSFTGNATVVTKDQLLKTNNKNAIAALQAFDPSFRLKDANIWGSDPNSLPEFSIRGESSIGMNRGLDVESARRSQRTNLADNPNLPIFILDGFEVSVQKIYDMDINRIESMTILKDAAATALYGSRASNGVIVVTTVPPKPGELRIAYNFTAGAEFPDLSDYNLCNASEMLQVEKMAGLYDAPADNPAGQIQLDMEYNDLLNEVRRGVQTDWLAQPLRTGVGHRHSLYMEGGDERLRYGIDLLYNDVKGVMKGSDRQTFTGGFTLSYRYKDLLFRNQFSTSLNRADDSPYGAFSEYAAMNPY